MCEVLVEYADVQLLCGQGASLSNILRLSVPDLPCRVKKLHRHLLLLIEGLCVSCSCLMVAGAFVSVGIAPMNCKRNPCASTVICAASTLGPPPREAPAEHLTWVESSAQAISQCMRIA